MKAIIAVIGAIVGAKVADWSGLLFGAALGWLGGAYVQLQQSVQTLRDEVESLQQASVRREAMSREAMRRESAPSETSHHESPAASTAMRPMSSPAIPATASASVVVETQRDKAQSAAPISAWESGADDPQVGDVAATKQSTPIAINSATKPQSSPKPLNVVRTEPDAFDRVVDFIKDWFTGGNTLVRVGAVILFFGVAFLLKYAAEHTYVPVELRLSAVALGAVGFLVLGWRLRGARAGYALALQGTAVGVLYLVIFAAFRMHVLQPALLAFVLMCVVCALAAMLAVLQNAMSFAVLGFVGGFLAPVLLSTGQGSHVALFTYYLLLNLGIFAIAWFKSWRPLNLVGFFSTFVIGTAWGVQRYETQFFASTEPFLIAFFLLYVAIAVLFATRQRPELRGYVDGSLTFGTPLIAFGLQAAMLRQDRYGLAFSAVAVSALYLSLAAWVMKSARDGLRTLAQAFWALGVVFGTLAVPLALSGRWTAATWSLEGVAILWLGLQQQRRLPRIFGLLLQVAAGISLWAAFKNSYSFIHSGIQSGILLNGVLLASTAWLSAALLLRDRPVLAAYEQPLPSVLFVWGLCWWFAATMTDTAQRLDNDYVLHTWLILWVGTALLCSGLARWLVSGQLFSLARGVALSVLPMLALFALVDRLLYEHPALHLGWLAWPLCAAIWYWVLKRDEQVAKPSMQAMLHMSTTWLWLALLAWQLSWAIDKWVQGAGSWPRIAWALVPVTYLFVLPVLTRRLAWPVKAQSQGYVFLGGAGVVAYLLWWSLSAAFNADGDAAPLMYLPLLNPLDLTQVAVWLAIIRWWQLDSEGTTWRDVLSEYQTGVWAVAGGLVFIWLNAVLLRTLHHWAQVPLNASDMMASTLVQTSVSIFWTTLAIVGMWLATHWQRRVLWLVGAALLAVVVVKLILIDLSNVGTVARIVSFMVVGGLMLAVGYFAPLPPASQSSEADQSPATAE